jgi:NAD(P)-dependent dehydrogenase (short-subunit alcohol dehydrogenase family)
VSQPLQDKVVVVTGAAQGIGLQYAVQLAADGAAVVVADLQDVKAAEAAEAIRATGGRAIAVPLDITDDRSNAELVEKTLAEYGRIDGLVNNAALYSGIEIIGWTDIEVDDWDRMMRINVRGLWQTSRAVVPAMRSTGGGSIVNVASIAAWGMGIMHYAVSKAAVIGLTRTMAKLAGADNITVNAIAPGVIATEATLNLVGGDPARLERRVEAQALKRVGQPEDLAGTISFLCSDAARWMTGQVIIVDGGSVML